MDADALYMFSDAGALYMDADSTGRYFQFIYSALFNMS
jgi:hypothetical protein